MRRKILLMGIFVGIFCLNAVPVLADESTKMAETAQMTETTDTTDTEGVVDTKELATSGTCGANVRWSISGDAGSGYILSITGSGAMYGFDDLNRDPSLRTPWKDYKPNIVRVEIADEVTTIGSYAFCDCTRLVSINIPSGLKVIGEVAFSNVPGLTSFEMPNTVNKIGYDAFRDCVNLSYLTISTSSTLSEIPMGAFCGCRSLSVVRIPNNIKIIGEWAFEGCWNLTKVRIPASLTTLGELAFTDCPNLKSIYLPSSVTKIGPYAVGFMGEGEDCTRVPGFVVYGYDNSMANKYCTYPDYLVTFVSVSAIRRNVRNFVERMYTVALDRTAESIGVEYWVDELTQQMRSGAEVCDVFLLGDEMTARNLSNEEFVNKCYLTLFDREADQGGFDNWMRLLNNGVSRRYVMASFCRAPEYVNLLEGYLVTPGSITLTENRDMNENITMYVFRCYDRTLNRTPEIEGINYWTGLILSRQADPLTVAKSIVLSQEFIGKNYSNEDYVKILYRMFFDREYDDAGLHYWVGELQNGTSRENILNAFGATPEFAGVLASFGF